MSNQSIQGGTLMDHSHDGFPCTYEDLGNIPVPELDPKRPRWRPYPYVEFTDTVDRAFKQAGLRLLWTDGKFALTHGGNRMFGVVPIHSDITRGWVASAAVRSSYDSTFAPQISLAQVVMICTNLSVWGEVNCAAKSTESVDDTLFTRFLETAERYLGWLRAMQEETQQMQAFHPAAWERSHLMIESVKRGVFPGSLLGKVITELDNPQHEEFADGSAWSLLNAFTEVSKQRSVAQQWRHGSGLINLFREHFLQSRRGELTAQARAAAEDMEREYRLSLVSQN